MGLNDAMARERRDRNYQQEIDRLRASLAAAEARQYPHCACPVSREANDLKAKLAAAEAERDKVKNDAEQLGLWFRQMEARAVKAEGERDDALRRRDDKTHQWSLMKAERDAAEAKYQKQLILHREAQQACARNKRSWKASRMREVLQGIINGWKAEAMSVRQKLEDVREDRDVLHHALDRLYHAAAEQQHTLASRGWYVDSPEVRWSRAGAQWHQYQEVEGAVLDARTVLEQDRPGNATKILIERMRAAEARVSESDGGTYGELPESMQQLIEGHKWDNMTRGEQRSWLIELAAKHVELRNRAEQLGLWFRQNEQALVAANARIAELEKKLARCIEVHEQINTTLKAAERARLTASEGKPIDQQHVPSPDRPAC